MPKSYSFEEMSSQIPGETRAAPPAEPKEDIGPIGRVFQKAGEAAEAVGPVGLAAGGALKLAGRAPKAVQMMAGPVQRGARTLAEALTPTSLRGLGGAVGSAGLAGGSSEIARQMAESGGAGKTGQQIAEMAGGFAPSGAAAAAKRATAPLVEAAGKKLYSIPEAIKTPEKERILGQAKEAGLSVLPSEIRESRPLKMIERLMQLVPGSKEEFVKFGRENQTAANAAIAKAFGGLEPSFAPTAMKAADDALGKSYKDLLEGKTFSVSKQTADKLSDAFNRNEQLREFAVGSSKVGQFAQSLEQGQQVPAPLWKEVRSEIAGYVYNLEGAPKQVGKEVLKQFDDLARQGLGANDYKVLQGIDKKYAALKSFEDAYARNPNIIKAGDADINKFAQQYAGVEPNNVLYGRTEGRGGSFVPLTEVGQTYNIFSKPRMSQTEATTLGGLLRAGTGMSLIGGGLAGGIPYLPAAGAMTMAAPPVARGAAQAYLKPEETAARLRQSTLSPYGAIPAVTSQTRKEQ
jgi:hypothetical protein